MRVVFKDFVLLKEDEIKEILKLRNQENIRENMLNSGEIALKDHLFFIENLAKIKNKRYFAIFEEDKLLGSVNFTKEDILSWGLYFQNKINPILKTCSIYVFLNFIFSNFDEDINSFVKKSNLQALNFNKNFGFKSFKEDNELVYLKLSKDDWEDQKSSKLLKPIKKYLDKIEFIFKDKR